MYMPAVFKEGRGTSLTAAAEMGTELRQGGV